MPAPGHQDITEVIKLHALGDPRTGGGVSVRRAESNGQDENVMRQTYSHPPQESSREVGKALFGA